MKEAIVAAGPKVEVVDSSIPEPGPEQVVIKVVFSGSNPKDWKYAEWKDMKSNAGDDIAGYVHKVGDKVVDFQPGDRVAAFHEMFTPGGSYAEYALAWEHTTFHIPKNTSFEDAATLPLAAMTSALGLYHSLGLPQPWTPATEPIPLIVYGGATAVGGFTIKLAQRSNIHPIIAVAGRGIPFVEGLLDKSKGDAVIDYRKGDEAVVEGIKKALDGKKVYHVYDCVSEKGSYINCSKVLEKGGKLNMILPPANKDEIPDGITHIPTFVGEVHKNAKDFGYVHFRGFTRGLQEGWLSGHPYEVVAGGLNGIQQALENLKAGKASAVKYIFKIEDTPGVSK